MLDSLSPRRIQENVRTSARNAWLASLGAVATVEEETSQLFDQLVSRGRKFESRRWKQVEDTLETAENEVESMFDRLSSTVERQVATGLEKISIPTRNEIRELTSRVEQLTGMIYRMKTAQEVEVEGQVSVKAETVKSKPASSKATAKKSESKTASRSKSSTTKTVKVETAKPKTATSKTATSKTATSKADTSEERKVYHVTTHEEGWKVQAEGAQRASRVTDTKAEAVEAARELAKNQEPSQVVIHRQDGTIQTHYSYDDAEDSAS